MSRRRQQHQGVTDLCWRYLNDLPISDEEQRDGFEYSMLESNQHDHSAGYRTQDAWERHRDTILADWIRRYPGTRPLAFWRFDSGLKRKVGPMKLTENITARNVSHSWRDSVPEDQRAWLVERGLLEASE